MSEETLQQRCTVCGETFPVANARLLPMIPTKCPSCLKTGRLTEDEAIAAAVAAGERVRRDADSDRAFYAKRVGAGAAVLGLCGLVLLLGRYQLTQGEFNPFGGLILLALLTAGGAVLWYWGYTESGRDES